MYDVKKTLGELVNLAVIPARGGSKRIPRKNIKLFDGKPMLAWSILAAQASQCFDRIVVSTDDQDIADIAKDYGAEVPFMRPKELSDDFIGTSPVVRHAIEVLQAPNINLNMVCCIYATAPFLKGSDIKHALTLYDEFKPSFVFSVGRFAYPIQRALKMNQEQRIEMLYPEHNKTRSQDLEEAYHDAGQFYLGNANAWLSKTGMFSGKSVPYVVPNHRVQDIDTPEDWVRAEYMRRALRESGEL